MLVYKFGGASIASVQRMKDIVPIILHADQPLLVIVSAMGKTTNALENVVKALKYEGRAAAEILLDELIAAHTDYIDELLLGHDDIKEELFSELENYITELRWTFDDVETHAEDYIYDQIVCIGELLSTLILSAYLNALQVPNTWLDARDIIRTNEHYRQAVVDECYTQKMVDASIAPLLKEKNIVITQGFIGASDNNNSTTLGREGSDYSAALLGAMLAADGVTIWKDVPGFLNADPRKFKDTIHLKELSYHEVIELAYYGAQIIHPKTIKPLQNAGIPLFVKCFLDEQLPGTKISNVDLDGSQYPPLIVHKGDQMMIKLTTKDFSFITEENLSKIYNLFASHRVKINMLQHAAISFTASIDMHHFSCQKLIEELNKDYNLKMVNDCTILTVRHYADEDEVLKLINDNEILITQKSQKVYQILYK